MAEKTYCQMFNSDLALIYLALLVRMEKHAQQGDIENAERCLALCDMFAEQQKKGNGASISFAKY